MDPGQIGNDGSNALVHVALVIGQGGVHATIPNQNMVATIAIYLDQPMQKLNFVIAHVVPVRELAMIVFLILPKITNHSGNINYDS